MKAAVVNRFDRPLVVEDVPVPEPGPEQVPVRPVLDGTAGAARSVFRMEPVEVPSAGHQVLATA